MIDDAPDVGANIQRDALFHLERTGHSVIRTGETIKLLQEDQFSDEITDRLVEALASEVQAAYTGFEAVVTRILKLKGIHIEKSGAHHAELLKAVVSNGILTDETLTKTFFDLLGFRHFYRNAYGCDLRNEEVVEKAQNLCATWPMAEKLLAENINQL